MIGEFIGARKKHPIANSPITHLRISITAQNPLNDGYTELGEVALYSSVGGGTNLCTGGTAVNTSGFSIYSGTTMAMLLDGLASETNNKLTIAYSVSTLPYVITITLGTSSTEVHRLDLTAGAADGGTYNLHRQPHTMTIQTSTNGTDFTTVLSIPSTDTYNNWTSAATKTWTF